MVAATNRSDILDNALLRPGAVHQTFVDRANSVAFRLLNQLPLRINCSTSFHVNLPTFLRIPLVPPKDSLKGSLKGNPTSCQITKSNNPQTIYIYYYIYIYIYTLYISTWFIKVPFCLIYHLRSGSRHSPTMCLTRHNQDVSTAAWRWACPM